MSDSRDTNHDGHVSLTEKIKDKLHLHRHRKHKKDKKGTRLSDAGVGHSSIPVAQPYNHEHHISTSEKLAGASALGVGAVGAAAMSSSSHDSRDLNRDGHVSASEKLQAAGSYAAGSADFDSRDLNRDGHVSASEKLQAAASSHGGTSLHDSRDFNYDGHVSMSEKLEADAMAMDTSTEQARLKLYEEQLAVSKREVSAGEINLVKRVQEEYVQQSVPVMRQEVVMERRPYSGDDSTRIPEKDEIARVVLYREEVVTEKRLVPVEEVVVHKDVVTDHATVGATLRSEYVETAQKNVSTSANVAYDYAEVSDKHLATDRGVSMKAARG